MDYGLTDANTTIDNDINVVLDNPGKRNRSFQRKSSVILPFTGERVRRSISFNRSNYNYESFIGNIENSSSSVLDDSTNGTITEVSPLLHSREASFQTKLKIFLYYVYTYFIENYNDDKFKSILKSSIAYLIASLGVYWTPFNQLMGKSDFKHVISTVVVYFHPARTKGSMHITLIYVIISICFSFTVSFGCRFLSALFYNSGSEEVSYAIDLVVSSISLGIVSFMKQKVNKETFNTACSLASISIVACIIKEGSLNGAIIPIGRLLATLKIVCVGCAISVFLCYFLWPKTAENQFRKDLDSCYSTMSYILSIITNRFLMGDRLNQNDHDMFNKFNAKSNSLAKNLQDAKYELYLTGREEEWKHLEELANITMSLSTHLKALKSSTEMQWKLLHENDQQQNESSGSSVKSFDSGLVISLSVENLTNINADVSASNLTEYVAINSSQIFDLFVYYLAPPTKSFIFTLKNILNDVPFESNEQNLNFQSKSAKFKKSLKTAIKMFDEKQANSFDKLYNQEIFTTNTDFLFKSDLEEVAACCGNFTSLLKLFGEELMAFLDVVYDEPDDIKTWKWLRFWEKEKEDESDKKHAYTSNLNDALFYLQNQYSLKQDAQDNVNVGKSAYNYYSHKLWQNLKVFKRTDIQFGIRVGLGAFVLSLFAFHPRTKFLFNNWRGEWSLTIYCIMMNKSLGGTQTTVKWRLLGTFLGCMIAWLVWYLFDGHPLALGLTGFLLSIPCFNIIIYWKKNNPFGRFILLAYNLTVLYSYVLEQHDSEDDNEGGENPIVSEIAFHRFISVSIGIIWALVMASIFIPNSARSRLKSGLTIIWLRLGVIWNSDPLDYKYDPEIKEYQLISLKGGETSLNNLLNELQVLVKQAPLEFRIKGKFPTKKYEALITSTSKIVDAFHNMILLIEVEPILNDNEIFVINYIENERHELEHRIFLIFYMIASSMKLQFPLPNKPASTEHAKDRLLYKLSEVRSNANDKLIKLSNEDYVLLYSYILVTSIITQELDKIIEIIKQLMGDISEEIFQLV